VEADRMDKLSEKNDHLRDERPLEGKKLEGK